MEYPMERRLVFLRRELWEHRALVVTPLVIGALVVLGFLVLLVAGVARGIGFEPLVSGIVATGEAGRLSGVSAVIALPLPFFQIGLAFVVFFYCLDALYAERKDRSILFWRSLPVTDTETVLSKLATAALVAPLITFGFIVAVHLALLALATVAVWIGSGSAWDLVWRPVPLFSVWLVLFYGMLAYSLWLLPFLGWFLLCSAFARKAVFLVAVLPFVVVPLLEQLLLGSSHFARLVLGRPGTLPAFDMPGLEGGFDFSERARQGDLLGRVDLVEAIDLGGFLSSPGLWGGLAVAALFTAGAVYLRRYRDDNAG